MKGKGGLNLINHLQASHTPVTDKKQVAELVTTNLFKNCSTENYYSDFQRVKIIFDFLKKEKEKKAWTSKNKEEYKLPFSEYRILYSSHYVKLRSQFTHLKN